MIVCSIHQPNFFPWVGYFDKIRKADVFIFLDEVAYPKSGSGSGSWCNRVKLLNSGIPNWFGLPITKTSGLQKINEVCFSNKEFHLKKLKKTLEHNYKKSPFFLDVMHWVEPLFDYPTDLLSDYNINAITKLSNMLGFNTKLVKQSELTHSKQSTELLIELLHQVNATEYLCGGGASGYQEDDIFPQNNINLIYQNFNQTNTDLFQLNNLNEQGLSILHYLFNTGLPKKELDRCLPLPLEKEIG